MHENREGIPGRSFFILQLIVPMSLVIIKVNVVNSYKLYYVYKYYITKLIIQNGRRES